MSRSCIPFRHRVWVRRPISIGPSGVATLGPVVEVSCHFEDESREQRGPGGSIAREKVSVVLVPAPVVGKTTSGASVELGEIRETLDRFYLNAADAAADVGGQPARIVLRFRYPPSDHFEVEL